MAGQILLVDDCPDTQRLLSLYLKKAGFSVALAENGREATEMAAAKAYDLILMDMQMPVMDGHAATQALRTSGNTTPIIALTAESEEGEIKRCLDEGCSDHVQKPVKKDRLLKVVSRFLGKQNKEEVIVSTKLKEEPFLAPLIEEFIENLPNRLKILTEGYSSQNWEQVRAEAHRFSIAANYGFAELTQVGFRLQDAAINGDPQEIGALIDRVSDLIRRIQLGAQDQS